MKARYLPLACSVVLGLLLASCAPAAPPAPTAAPAAPPAKQAVQPTPKPGVPAPTPKPAGEQPRSGGVLATVMNGDLASFDVQQETGLLTHATAQVAYNGLVQFQPSEPDKVIADLAESWEASADGTVYTFRLRKDVKFHDGSTLTAEDVKFSIDRIYNPPRNIRSPRQGTLKSIKEVTIVDPGVVRIALSYAQGSFLPMLAVGQVVVYPRKVVEAKGDMRKDMVGTGPFAYKDYSLGILLEFKKFANYFVPGRPYLDGVRFYVVKDESTKLSAFRTGQLRLIDPSWPAGLRPSQVQTIRRDMPQASLAQFPSISSRWFNMVVTLPPFTDIRVRRAVSLAVDRQAAIKVLEGGEAELGSNFVPGSEWSLPEAELLKLPGYRQPKDQDIADARKLLADAGFDKGLKTKILARAGYSDDMAVLMKEQIARIGVDAELVIQESAAFLDTIYRLTFPMVTQPIGVRMSDPDEFTRYFRTGGGQSQTGLSDKDVDALFDAQSRAVDSAERKKLVRQLEAKLLDLSNSVPLYWSRGNIAYWPEVKNYYRGGVYNNNKYQDVWLAK
ncbi:MAG: ABC transporter substrate-binding protein [Chloroflexi bacterium]|nr:ABC transporter substrate-binding protein [Chloroflexota bacterium]